LLQENGVQFNYRDYRKEPLSEIEIRAILSKLGVGPKDVLRRRDRAFRELELTGDEPDAELIAHMAEHPTLLERPIGLVGKRAALGRPPENLLSLV